MKHWTQKWTHTTRYNNIFLLFETRTIAYYRHNAELMRRKTDSIELIRSVSFRIACFPAVMWDVFVIHHLQRNAYQAFKHFSKTISFNIPFCWMDGSPYNIACTWCTCISPSLFVFIHTYTSCYVFALPKQKNIYTRRMEKYSIQFSGQLFSEQRRKL